MNRGEITLQILMTLMKNQQVIQIHRKRKRGPMGAICNHIKGYIEVNDRVDKRLALNFVF